MSEDDKSYAIRSCELLRSAHGSYSDWLGNVDRWIKYANQSQWTGADKKRLETLGIAALTHDFILPCVEQGTSFLTSKSPRFHAVGVDPDDVDLGSNISDLLSYVWYISTGDTEFYKHVYDYYVKGKGVWFVEEDPEADQGRGELKIYALDPRNVFFDPSSKDIYCRDAEWVIVWDSIQRNVALTMFPEYEKEIKEAKNSATIGLVTESTVMAASGFAELSDVARFEDDPLDYIRRYQKRRKRMHRVLFVADNVEPDPLTDREFAEAKKMNYAVVGGNRIVDEEAGIELMNTGEDVRFATLSQLISEGLVEHAPYFDTVVDRYVSIGDVELSKTELEIDEYPVVPCHNKHNRTPFSMSDVAGAVSRQDFYNKLISIVTTHEQMTTAYKALIPKGAGVDFRKLEEGFSKPVPYFGEYNAEALQAAGGSGIITFAVPPLSAMIPNLLSEAKHGIEYQFGIFESMMGSGSGAPETFRGTMAIDEFGQRRMRAKKASLENALSFFGSIVVRLAQKYYTIRKLVRITLDDQTRTVVFNQPQDEQQAAFQAETMRANDLSRNRYDIRVIAGSSLPTNRWAEVETLKEIVSQGVPQLMPELIRRLDIPNAAKIADSIMEMQSAGGQINSLNQRIKELEGQLQVARRESLTDEKKVELMKFVTKLKALEADIKANSKIEDERVKYEATKIIQDFVRDLQNEQVSLNSGEMNA